MELPLGASLIPTAYQLVSGIYQGIKAANMNPQRPTYSPPQGEKDALLNAKIMAQSGLPGRTTMEQNQAANVSSNIAQLRESAQGPNNLMSSLTKLNANEMAGTRDIGMKEAQNYINNQAMLRGAEQRYGAFEDKAWKYNEADPFEAEAKAQAALIQAQNQNIYGATTSAANTATQNEQLKLMRELYLPKKDAAGNPTSSLPNVTPTDLSYNPDYNPYGFKGAFGNYSIPFNNALLMNK